MLKHQILKGGAIVAAFADKEEATARHAELGAEYELREFMLPSYAMGGTPAEHLLEDARLIGDYLRDAIEAMECNGPNSRDYTPERMREALAQHELRLSKVRDVLGEIEAMRDAASDAMDRRR